MRLLESRQRVTVSEPASVDAFIFLFNTLHAMNGISLALRVEARYSDDSSLTPIYKRLLLFPFIVLEQVQGGNELKGMERTIKVVFLHTLFTIRTVIKTLIYNFFLDETSCVFFQELYFLWLWVMSLFSVGFFRWCVNREDFFQSRHILLIYTPTRRRIPQSFFVLFSIDSFKETCITERA